VRSALRRLCRAHRGRRAACRGRRGFHRARQLRLGGPARCGCSHDRRGITPGAGGGRRVNARQLILGLGVIGALGLGAHPLAAQTARPNSHAPDIAYGAFQRGFYMTAFTEASKRAEQNDFKAMTLLGELYANGLGVARDDQKAAEWYKRAADHGDREAMFALGMFYMDGRGGAANRDQGAKLLASAAKLGNSSAAYNLGLLYLEGQQFPQDFTRAGELFRAAARAGNPDAQYALATMYKEGRGVSKDPREAARLMGQAALAENLDAIVEYAIMLFNGEGITKDEKTAAALLEKAAHRGSPIAQNRLANLLAVGRGLPANPTEAIKWHIIAKSGGAADPALDDFMARQKPDVRSAGEAAAEHWLATLARQ